MTKKKRVGTVRCGAVLVAAVMCLGCSGEGMEGVSVGTVHQRLVYPCTDAPGSGEGFLYVAPPGSDPNDNFGDDNNAGTSCTAPLATLTEAHNRLPDGAFSRDYRVLIRGGTYQEGHKIAWTKFDTSETHSIAIESFPGEVATFDGTLDTETSPATPLPRMVKFQGQTGPAVNLDCGRSTNVRSMNITVRGIHLMNFHQHGITLENARGVTIEDSWFTNIGNRWWPSENCAEGTSPCGLGVVGFSNSDDCTLSRNTFSHIENARPDDDADFEDTPDLGLIHVTYIANDSDCNRIEDNYVEFASGDPFKTRNGSDDNIFARNVTIWSGGKGFLSTQRKSGEVESHGGRLIDNVALFPHPDQGNRLDWCDWDSDPQHPRADCAFATFESGFLYPVRPATETITAVAGADLVGNDGTDELLVAYKYPGHDGQPAHPNLIGAPEIESITRFVRVASTSGRGDQFLSQLVYRSTSWDEVPAMARGDFDGSGTDQLLMAFHSPSWTRVYRYRGTGDLNLMNLGKILEVSGSATRITALASGNFLNGTSQLTRGDEVLAATQGSSTSIVWVGNGEVASGVAVMDSAIWSSGNESVAGLTTGDFDGNGNPEIAAALNSSTGTRVVRGSGSGSAGSGLDGLDPGIYTSSLWRIPTLVAAVGPGVDELYAGFERSGDTRTYRIYDIASQRQLTNTWDGTSYWNVAAQGRRRLGSCQQVISALLGGGGRMTRIYAGNATNHNAFGNYSEVTIFPSSGASSDETTLPHRTRDDVVPNCF